MPVYAQVTELTLLNLGFLVLKTKHSYVSQRKKVTLF